jgi:hypothetical protein
VAELERRVGGVAALNAQTDLAAAPDAAASEAKPARAQKEVETRGVTIRPYGFLVGNATYNTHALVPGNIGFFSVPEVSSITARQFSVSAGNTFVGADLIFPDIGSWALAGKFDFNLRGSTPVTEDNVFAPYFANVYLEARTSPHRILAGLASDFVSPLSPRSLNLYPGSYLPCDLGTNRPQVRYECQRSVGDATTLVFQGGIATAVQTFQVSDEVLGFGTDVPDLNLRVGLGRGDIGPASRKRPLELGLSGHVGRRRALRVAVLTERDFTTWSGNIDAGVGLGARTRLEGEVFVESILGDYKGGILHTFNPIREVGVRAAGGWAQLHYQVNPRLSVAGGYGLDDTFDDDLSTGFRSKNDVIQGNFFYNISPRLVFGVEVSRWRTNWVGVPDGRVIRVEPAIFYVF